MGKRFKFGKTRIASIMVSALICCIFALLGIITLSADNGKITENSNSITANAAVEFSDVPEAAVTLDCANYDEFLTNWTTVQDNSSASNIYKLRLTANITVTRLVALYGGYVIIDLNGYTITSAMSSYWIMVSGSKVYAISSRTGGTITGFKYKGPGCVFTGSNGSLGDGPLVMAKNINFVNNINDLSEIGASGTQGIIQVGSTDENKPGTIIIKECLFSGNVVKGNGGAIICGGNTTATIDTCTFRNNASGDGYKGGAIYVNGAGGKITATNTDFNGNSAQKGGAIYVNNNCKATLNNCNFIDNTAKGEGGAIYSDGEITVNGGTFLRNKANSCGAIYSYRATKIDGAAFSLNSATKDSGALYACVTVGEDNWVKNCTFTSNTAAGGNSGAGAFRQDGSADITIENCIFTKNYAQTYGGAVGVNQKNITLKNCTFTENSAGTEEETPSTTIGGGAIFNMWGMTVLDCTFTDNKAFGHGGAIYCGNNSASYGPLTISGSTFTGNTSYSNGGAILAIGHCTISDSEIKDNTAANGGGVYASINSNSYDFNITGKLIITDNKKLSGERDNLFLETLCKIKIPEELSAETRIGISLRLDSDFNDGRVLTSGYGEHNSKAPSKYFFLDYKYGVGRKDGEAVIKFCVSLPEATEGLAYNAEHQNAVNYDDRTHVTKIEFTDTENNVTVVEYGADGTVASATYKPAGGVSNALAGEALTKALANWSIDGDGGVLSAKYAGSYKITYDLSDPKWDGTTYSDGTTVYNSAPADLTTCTPWQGDLDEGVEPNYWTVTDEDGAESWTIELQVVLFTIAKGDYDLTRHTFADVTKAYANSVFTDGTTIAGELLEGVTVAYTYTYVPANTPAADPVAATEVKNSGVYKITATFSVDRNWNYISDTLVCTYTVTQLTPTVSGVALKYPDRTVYAQGRLPALDCTSSAAGSVEVKAGTVLQVGNNSVDWVFTPEDAVNYIVVESTTANRITIVAIESTGLPYPTIVVGTKIYKGGFYDVASTDSPESVTLAAIYWRANGSSESFITIYGGSNDNLYEGWYLYDAEAGKVSLINAGEYIVEFKLYGDGVWDGTGDDPNKEDVYWTGDDDPLTTEDERISNKQVEVTIAPKNLTLEWSFEEDGYWLKDVFSKYYTFYDGKKHEPTASLDGICERENYGATVELSFTYENKDVKTGAIQNVTAGEYKATARLDFSKITSPDYLRHVVNNYRIAGLANADDAVETTYTIRKRPLKVEFEGDGEFEYDGKTHGVKAEVVAGAQGGILAADKASVLAESSFEVKYTSADTSASKNAPKNAAVWTATATLKHVNYELDGEYTCEIDITPKTVKVKWTGKTAFTYNGTHQAPAAEVEGLVEGDELKLSVVYNSAAATGASSAVNAGGYTAVAGKARTNNNYTLDASTVEQEFSIAKKQVAVAWSFPDGDFEGTRVDGVYVWKYDGLNHAPVATVQGVNSENLALSLTGGAGNSAVNTSNYTVTVALDGSDAKNANYVLDATTTVQQYKIIKRVITADGVSWSRDNHAVVPNDLSFDWGVLKGNTTPEYSAVATLSTQGGVSWTFTTADGASAELKLTVEYYLSSGTLCSFAEGVEWRAGEYFARLKLSTAAANSFEFEDGANVLTFKVVAVSGNKVAVQVIWAAALEVNGSGIITGYTAFDPEEDTPFIYNGNAQAVKAIFEAANGEYVELETNDISKNINAGKYVVYLMPSEQYSFDEYVCEYTIRALKVKLEWSGNDLRDNKFEWVYNGKEIVPEVDFDFNFHDEGMLAGDYQNLLQDVVIATSGAVNAGLGYTARATLSKNFEIVDGTEEQEFDILKYALNSNNISWSGDEEGVEIKDTNGKVTAVRWNYDAKAHKPNAKATVRIYVDGVLQDVVLELIVSGESAEPGVHKAYAALDGSIDLHGNFSLSDTAGITFNIAAMVISNVHWTGNEDGTFVWTYDGDLHAPKAYFVPDGKDADDEDNFVWLKVEGEYKDAGKYVAKVVDNFTFTDEDARLCNFSIEKATLEVVWKWVDAVKNTENGTYSWVYDGLAHAPTIETLYGVKGEEIDFEISSFTVAGKHESVLTIKDKNYTVDLTDGGTDRQSFVINKADISELYGWTSDTQVDGEYVFEWQYNGKKPVLGLDLADPDTKFVLAAGSVEVEFGFEYNVVATKGLHTATATLKKAQIINADGTLGDELDVANFTISAAKAYEITAFEITVEWDFGDAQEKTLEDGVTKAYYWVYDGTGHAPIAKYLDWNGNEVTVSAPKRVNANTYTEAIDLPANCVFAKVDGKSTGECGFTITKAEVEVEWKFDTEGGVNYWTYDGNMHAPKAFIKDTETELKVEGSAKEAGEGYIATAALTDAANYVFKTTDDATCKFDILVKEVLILWVDNSPKVGGNPFTWTYNNREYKPQAFLAELDGEDLVAIEENGKRVEITVSGGQYNANVGDTYYTARAEDTFNNYSFKGGENGAELTQEFRILQRSLANEMRWSDADKFDSATGNYVYSYNGLSQGPYVNISGREFVYEITDNATGKAVSSATNRGVYTITAACADTNYYIPASLASVTVDIKAFKIDVLWTGVKDGVVEIEYAGHNVQPEAWYSDAFGNVITLDVTVDGAHHEDVRQEPYVAHADFKSKPANDNYVLDKNLTVNFIITPKTITIEWDDENNSCTYDGQPHGADFAATLKDAITADIDGKLNVEYVLKQGNKTLTDKEVINAGSYTVEITLTGDKAKNYTLSRDKYGFRIAKRTLDITVKGEEVNYGSPAPKYTAETILGALTSEEEAVKEAVEKCLTSDYTSRSLPKDEGYAIELYVNKLLTLLPNYTVEFADGKPVYTGNVVIVKTSDGVVYWLHNDVKVIDDELTFEYNGNEQRLNAYYLQGGKRVDIAEEDIAYMLYDSATDTYALAPADFVAKNAGTYYLKAANQGGFDFGDSAYVKYVIAPREIEINLNRIDKVYGTTDTDGNDIVLLPDELLQASWSYGTPARPVDGDDFNIIISSNAYDAENSKNGFVQAGIYFIYGKFEGSANYSVTFNGVNNEEAPEDRKDLGVYYVAKADITDVSMMGTQWFYDEYVIERYQKYFIRIEDKEADGTFQFVKYAGDQTAKVEFSYSDPYALADAPVPDENESYPNTKSNVGIGSQGQWAINYRITIDNHNVYYGQWHVLIKLADDYVIIIIEKPYEVQYGDSVPDNFTEILVEGGYVTFGGAVDSRDKAAFLAIAEAYVPLGYEHFVNNRTPVGEYNILFRLNVPEDSPLSVIYKRSNADQDSNIGKYVIKPRRLNVSWGETSFIFDGEAHLCTPVITNWLDVNAVLSMTEIANGKQYTIEDGGQLITVTVTTEGNFTDVGGHGIKISVNNGNYTLSIDDAARTVSIINVEAEKGLPKWLLWLIIGLGVATVLAILIIILLARRAKGKTVFLGAEDDGGFYEDAYNPDDPTGFSDPYYQDK